MPKISSAFIIIGVVLTACADFPDLDGAISDRARGAGYPDLIDLSEIPVAATGESDIEAISASLAARADNLRARAKRLRTPIIDNRTRRRLDDALRRHNP